jgi:hypothetical protein
VNLSSKILVKIKQMVAEVSKKEEEETDFLTNVTLLLALLR